MANSAMVSLPVLFVFSDLADAVMLPGGADPVQYLGGWVISDPGGLPSGDQRFGVAVLNRLEVPVIGGKITGTLAAHPAVADDGGTALAKPGQPTDPTMDWIDDPPPGRVAEGVWAFDVRILFPNTVPDDIAIQLILGAGGPTIDLAVTFTVRSKPSPGPHVGRGGIQPPSNYVTWLGTVSHTPAGGTLQSFSYDTNAPGPATATITTTELVARVRFFGQYVFLDLARPDGWDGAP